jgi:hypothetical protein
MAAHMKDTVPLPNTAPLWDRLRATFARVIAAIGAPAAIAVMTLTSRKARLDILRQLVMLENLVRKMLFADAAALPPPEAPRGPQLIRVPLRPGLVIVNPPQRRRARRTPRQIDLTRPETWSAPFALAMPRDPRLVPDHRAPRIRALWDETPRRPAPEPKRRAPPQRHAAPFRIARRFEALRRVLEDPTPHVRRLAAAHRRALRRSPEIVADYALRATRRSGYDPADVRLPVDIASAALIARARLCDTS